MKRRLQLVPTMTTLLVTSLTYASGAAALVFESEESLRLRGQYADNLFASGSSVDADFDSSDDVFVAGGEIRFRARTQESLYLAGGDLDLSRSEARDGILAGGDIRVSRGGFRELIVAGGRVRIEETHVDDDLVLFGGAVTLDSASRIGDSAVIGGNDVEVGGSVGGDAWISGRTVTIAGQIKGNVRVDADELRILPETVIGGDLTHAVHDLEIATGAQVSGRTVRIEPGDTWPWSGRHWPVVGPVLGILAALGTLLTAPITVLVFGRAVQEGRDTIRSRFWEALGKGLLTVLLVPGALVLLFISVIGAPVGVAALPFLFAAGIVGWSIAMYTIGDQLRRWLKKSAPERGAEGAVRKERFGWTVVGSIATALVMVVPFLGFLFWIVAFLAGVGAIATRITRPKASS